VNGDISLLNLSTGGGGGGGSGNATSTISSFITYINQLTSTLNADASTISTGIGFTLVESINDLTSTIEGNNDSYVPNNYLADLHASTFYTSSIILSGLRQPFIQYGTVTVSASSGSPIIVTLPIPYINTNYVIQVTSQTDNTTVYTDSAHILNTMFKIEFTTTTGMANVTLMWTTFGNIF